MKNPLLLSALLSTALLSSCSLKSHAPLTTASKVEVKRYTGLWHENFRLPNSFQRDDSKATAQYTLQADGSIKVVNTEIRPDGTTSQAQGTAKAVPDSSNSRLRVEFNGLAGVFAPNPKEGNYWIIDVAPDYSTALVGTPDRNYLWLLARTPQISKERRGAYVAKAKRLGFPTEKLLFH